MAQSPEQFLSSLAKKPPSPVYLFLGPEGYNRKLCKEALLAKALPPGERSDGFIQTDLEDRSLAEIIDDACSLSLFAQDRVIWVSSAELALPRRITAASEDADDPKSATSPLAAYLKRPTPGTVLVFECSRYDFGGDDRPKLERVQKFYSGIPAVIEFRPFSPEAVRFLAQQLAKRFELRLPGAELGILLDAIGGDAQRLATEIEKLALFVGPDRPVTKDDLTALVPNSSQSTIFALVNALSRRDRSGALISLDVLVREGEYLPLALTFLSTLFRLALAAKESKVTNAQQAQTFFQQLGIRVWRERTEQILNTAASFSLAHLRQAVAAIYETDKRFRDGYRNDQLIMETLIWAVT